MILVNMKFQGGNSSLTPEEIAISKCLDAVFNYCKSHNGSCENCIFFRYVQVGPMKLAYCRVSYAPDVFGESQRGNSDG